MNNTSRMKKKKKIIETAAMEKEAYLMRLSWLQMDLRDFYVRSDWTTNGMRALMCVCVFQCVWVCVERRTAPQNKIKSETKKKKEICVHIYALYSPRKRLVPEY